MLEIIRPAHQSSATLVKLLTEYIGEKAPPPPPLFSPLGRKEDIAHIIMPLPLLKPLIILLNLLHCERFLMAVTFFA